MPKPRLILGLESSCDDTAAAIVAADGTVLGQVIHRQLDEHARFGGVVPEVAARAHLAAMPATVQAALEQASCTLDDITAVAATAGPGLIGGVMVGAMVAKGICLARDIPFIAVNHLAAHALTVRLTHTVAFPYILLLVSGGHCQLLRVTSPLTYTLLGRTLDDAVGEAFDKVARLLAVTPVSGAGVEALALRGDANRFRLPRPLLDKEGCDFSFSGLKTAVRQQLPAEADAATRADMAASFQAAVADCLVAKSATALRQHPDATAFVVAGGVAANAVLRQRLQAMAAEQAVPFVAPPQALCTDNAVMVAWAGQEMLALGVTHPLDFAPRPRWPLTELAL